MRDLQTGDIYKLKSIKLTATRNNLYIKKHSPRSIHTFTEELVGKSQSDQNV